MSSAADAFSGFGVDVLDRGTTRTITPTGEIDFQSVDALRSTLFAAFSDRLETVVLDLGETRFIDSAVVNLVLQATARAQEFAVRLVVLPGPPDVQRAFELCGVTGEIPFVGGPEEAHGDKAKRYELCPRCGLSTYSARLLSTADGLCPRCGAPR